MTTPKKAAAAPPEPVVTAEELTNWEFIEEIPTRAKVLELLKTLPPVWGIEPAKYTDYVAGLPAEREFKRKGRSRWASVVTLYMSVAGRQAMLTAAQEKNGWMVDQRPTANVPEGNPRGFIRWDDERLVYVVETEIWRITLGTLDLKGGEGEPEWIALPEPSRLGVRYGMAWVPTSATGKSAKASNPYEKVQTSAIGRSIAGWGLGVLPGSGVASLDEMLGVDQNAAAVLAEQRAAAEPEPTVSREEREKAILDVAEEIAKTRAMPADAKWSMLADRCKRITGVDVAVARDDAGVPVTDDTHEVPVTFEQLRPSQLRLVVNSLRRELEEQS